MPNRHSNFFAMPSAAARTARPSSVQVQNIQQTRVHGVSRVKGLEENTRCFPISVTALILKLS